MQLEGDQVPARRDQEGQLRNRVLVLVICECFHRVTLLEQSASAERIWVILHSDRGPYLVWVLHSPARQCGVHWKFRDGEQSTQGCVSWGIRAW